MSRPTYRILVAEPVEVQRQLIDMLLSDTSFELTLVGTGREALEHLKEHSPDLCLLALDLHDVSGDEIGGKIRRVSRLARTPVVLISPQAGRFGLSDEARQRARRSGADLVLPRPLGDKNLRDRIQSLLDAREETPDREGYSTRIIDDALDEIEEIPEEVELGRPGTTHDDWEASMTSEGARDAHEGSDSSGASASGASDAAEALDRSEPSQTTDHDAPATNDTPGQATTPPPNERGHASAEAAEGQWASGFTHGGDIEESSVSGSGKTGQASGQDAGASRDASGESTELAQVRKDREILKVENAQLKRKLKEKAEQLERGVNQKLERKINELERRNSLLLDEIEKLKSERGGGGLFGRRS